MLQPPPRCAPGSSSDGDDLADSTPSTAPPHTGRLREAKLRSAVTGTTCERGRRCASGKLTIGCGERAHTHHADRPGSSSSLDADDEAEEKESGSSPLTPSTSHREALPPPLLSASQSSSTPMWANGLASAPAATVAGECTARHPPAVAESTATEESSHGVTPPAGAAGPATTPAASADAAGPTASPRRRSSSTDCSSCCHRPSGATPDGVLECGQRTVDGQHTAVVPARSSDSEGDSSAPSSLGATATAGVRSESGGGASGSCDAAPPTSAASGATPVRQTVVPPSSTSRLQQYGCCVFFFPTPFLSWLFPFGGHVAISNAEGTLLYTFEASYFVREERLADVLDRVVASTDEGGIYLGCGSSSDAGRSASRAGSGSGSDEEFADSLPPSHGSTRSATAAAATAGSARLGSSFGGSFTSVRSRTREGDGVSSAGYSPYSSPGFTSLAAGSASSGTEEETAAGAGAGRSTLHSPPPSRTRLRSLPSSPARRHVSALKGLGSHRHSHTTCVRVWDLKPLLMESRGRGARRLWLPMALAASSVSDSSRTASALWQRVQELLQAENGAPESVATVLSSFLSFSSATPPAAGSSAGSLAGSPGACPGSGSEADEERLQLLDSATAKFYNSNLQATINIFRGSPEGSSGAQGLIVRHTNSYSFVGFVLEACGIGGGQTFSIRPTQTEKGPRHGDGAAGEPMTAAPASPFPSSQSTDTAAAAAATAATMMAPGHPVTDRVGGASSGSAGSCDGEIAVDGISWGAWKIILNVSCFGQWHRSERRIGRAMHGGTLTGAFLVWAVLLSLAYLLLQSFRAPLSTLL